jgi:hypothetical protein
MWVRFSVKEVSDGQAGRPPEAEPFASLDAPDQAPEHAKRTRGRTLRMVIRGHATDASAAGKRSRRRHGADVDGTGQHRRSDAGSHRDGAREFWRQANRARAIPLGALRHRRVVRQRGIVRDQRAGSTASPGAAAGDKGTPPLQGRTGEFATRASASGGLSRRKPSRELGKGRPPR